MAVTNLAVVQDQIEKFWSPLFMKELRAKLLLGALVNKDYEGAIQNLGDTVRVSQINAPKGELRTVGVDADSFGTEALVTTKVDISANKRAVGSFEIENLVDLQSQIGAEKSDIRDSLMYAVEKQVNDYLYSLVNPDTSASPSSCLKNSVATMDAGQLADIRVRAAQHKWNRMKGWYGLVDPQYYGDLMNATTLANTQYGASDIPTIGGQVALPRFGFNLLEDDSRNISKGLFFHPDFLHLVMQQQPSFKISDQHVNKKFSYIISCDLIFGASLGIDGAKKHIFATAAASGHDAS